MMVCITLQQREPTHRHEAEIIGDGKEPAVPAPAAPAPAPAQSDKYAYIIFYVISNGGVRVHKITRDIIVGSGNKGKFLNDREVAGEFRLEAADTPYTILVCTRYPHETLFTLSLFTQEPIQLTPFPDNFPRCAPAVNTCVEANASPSTLSTPPTTRGLMP